MMQISYLLFLLRGPILPLLILTGGLPMLFADVSYNPLILKSDGSLHTFGNNNKGQLRDGTTSQRIAPTQILAPVNGFISVN